MRSKMYGAPVGPPMESETTTLERIADRLADQSLGCTWLEDGTGVILDVESMQVLSLNSTGAFLVRTIGGGCTDVQALIQSLQERYAVEPARAGEDVRRFLDTFGRYLAPGRS